jgi:D-arabinose 1-dehydrogenase-like Zn-dependent alcohol dehydrogenase
VRTTVTAYPLERAGDALEDLRSGRVEGAAAVRVADPVP